MNEVKVDPIKDRERLGLTEDDLIGAAALLKKMRERPPQGITFIGRPIGQPKKKTPTKLL